MSNPSRVLVCAAMLAIGCSGDGPTTPSTPAAAIAIGGLPAEGVMLVGASTVLSSVATSGTGAPVSRPITWTSRNPDVARVTGNGEVTALSAGPVIIVARADAAADSILLSVRVPITMTPSGAAAAATTTVLGGAVALTIPPGAGTVSQLTVAPAAILPDDDRLLDGAAFDFGPSGATFSTPITMSLRYDAAAVPAAKRSRLRINRVENDGSLTMLDGGAVDLVNARVSAPLSSFSTYALVVPADVASMIALEGNSQAANVGTPVQGLSVLVLDAQQRPVPLVDVGFTVLQGGGSVEGGSIATTGVNGVATLPGSWIMGSAKGPQALRATIVGDSRNVTFTATAIAPATTIRINDAPDSAFSGVSLPGVVVVQVLDDFGDPVNEIGRVLRATLVEGTGTLQGDTIQDAPTGSAIFQNLRIAGSGPHRIAFTSGTLTPDTTGVITVTQQLGSLVILTAPAGAASGAPFSTQPVIELRDNAGLRMLSGDDEVVASAVHGPGAPCGGLTATAVDGVATFSGLAIDGEGTQRLRFSVGFIDVISDEFTVGPTPEGVLLRVGPVPSIELLLRQSYGPDLTVDLSNRGTANIRRLQVEFTWDPQRIEWTGGATLPWADSSGADATVTVDESRAAEGVIVITGETPQANVNSFTLLRTGLRVRTDSPVGRTVVGVTVLEARNDVGASVPVNVRPLSVNIWSLDP